MRLDRVQQIIGAKGRRRNSLRNVNDIRTFVHESGSFPWKLGLDREILARRKGDEACPNVPATNPGFELFPLVDTDLETAQELTYFIPGRVSEVATERRAQINLQKLNEPEVAVVTRVELDAMRHITLCAKPLSHRVRWSQRNTAKAANPTLLPHSAGQCSFVEHGTHFKIR